MSDHDLFARARSDDPETSHEAASFVDVAALENVVLQALKRCGRNGATTHEIEDMTGLAFESVTPRMKPLEKKGLIERTRWRRTPRHHNRKQIVWVAY